MLNAPTKIILKNQTKMSLNSRFTAIMKTRPFTPQAAREQVSTDRLASEKNRRLAQQMEKRNLMGGAAGDRTDSAPKPSVMERLGQRGGGSQRGRGFVRGGGAVSRTFSASRGTFRGRGTFNQRGRGRGGQRGNFTQRGGWGTSRGRGRGSFRGGRGGKNDQKPEPVDKSKLDSDLDSYMSKTKGSMDAELDSYMADKA